MPRFINPNCGVKKFEKNIAKGWLISDDPQPDAPLAFVVISRARHISSVGAIVSSDCQSEPIFCNKRPRRHGSSQSLLVGLRHIARRFGVDARLSLEPNLGCHSSCGPGRNDRRQGPLLHFGIWLTHVSADRIKHQHNVLGSYSQRAIDARCQPGHNCDNDKQPGWR
jgi:hypothetical protein